MGFVDLPKIRSLIEPVLEALGYELVEVRFLSEQGRTTLRMRIDKEGGVTVGDCERVSREVETLLEVEGGLLGRYDLEVSSPGLDRPLVRESDFVRYAGKKTAIRTREPIEGRRNYKGMLKGVQEGLVLIEVDGRDFQIPFGEVERAHLVFQG